MLSWIEYEKSFISSGLGYMRTEESLDQPATPKYFKRKLDMIL